MEQLSDVLESKAKTEKDCFEKVGRRLYAMLDAVRETKNVAKSVQTALAEAMTAYRLAVGVRKQQQQVAELIQRKTKDAPPSIIETPMNPARETGPRVVPTSTAGVVAVHPDDDTTKSILESMVHEVQALRKEVSAIRTAQDQSGGDAADTGTWVDVVKRKGKAKATATAAPPTNAPDVRPQPTGPTVRQRPPAILVNVSADGFPELVKRIRGGVNQTVLGDSVVGMRQAKSGGMLIEVRSDQARVEAIRAEVAKSAGSEADVRALQQRALIEVCDLDQWTSSIVVHEEVCRSTGALQEAVKVISLRKGFGDSHILLVSLPLSDSRGLASSGRLRVGMISCRVKMAESKVRCFRFLAYGHTSKACDGPDRTACCRRCGETGHKAARCSATDLDASTFARVLQESKPMPSAGSYRSRGVTEDQCTPK